MRYTNRARYKQQTRLESKNDACYVVYTDTGWKVSIIRQGELLFGGGD